MPDDAEVKRLQSKLLDAEISRQLERHHASSSRVLREHLLSREPKLDERTGEVYLRGYWAGESLTSYLESLKYLEPGLFETEPVGTNDVPLPKLKTIFADDQPAINAHWKEISRGEITVIDRPNPRARQLRPGEILDTDPDLNKHLAEIRTGKLRVYSQDDLDRGLD